MENKQNKSNKKDFLDWAWSISKTIATTVATIMVPLGGVYFTHRYNEKQLEISRGEHIAKIVDKLTSENITHQEKKAYAMSLGVFQESAIPLLISFLADQEDPEIRKAATSALSIIGKKSVDSISDFLLNEFYPARFKHEAFIALKRIDKKKARKTAEKLGQEIAAISDQKRTQKGRTQPIRYGEDPFITRKIILELYKCGINLRGAYLPYIGLNFASLSGINFNSAYLKGAYFKGSNLRNAIFDEANLEGTKFSSADITGASFVNAKLRKVDFSGVFGMSSAKFSSSDFFEDQFIYPLTIERLCQVITDDNYNLSLNKESNTIGWLNKLLRFPDLYDTLNKKKAIVNFFNNINIKYLVDETKDYRRANFSNLNAYRQYNIMRVNRLLLENVYEAETPKLPVSYIPRE